MYAILKTGGKQYKAEKDMVLLVDKLPGDAGAQVEFTEVVMVCNGEKVTVGSPFVKGATVRGEIVAQEKGKKIHGYNYKPKKNQRKRWGHRQPMTKIRVTEVAG